LGFSLFLDGRRSGAVVMAATTVALAVVSPFSAVVLVGVEGVFVLWRRRDRLVAGLAAWAAGAAGALAVLVVWWSAEGGGTGGAAALSVTRALVSVLFPAVSSTLGETVSPGDWWLVLGALLAWALLVYGAVRVLGQARTQRASLDVWILLGVAVAAVLVAMPVAVSRTAALNHVAFQTPKLFFPFAPFMYVAAGAAFAWLVGHRPVLAVATAGLLAAVWGVGIVNLHRGRDFAYSSYALPWPTVINRVAAAADGRRVAIVTSDGPVAYYADRRLPGTPVIDVSDQKTGEAQARTAAAEAHGAQEVFLLNRPRVDPGLDARMALARGSLGAAGYNEVRSIDVGTIDPVLRRLQEKVSGRTLPNYQVQIQVLELTS